MHGESELVSVIIPTYNRPEKAIRAVDSVRAQTYRALEVIVVDDRSDASCQRALRDALRSRDKVRFYVNDGPKGCAGARNVGLEAVKGAYVAFLDDDDEYLPTKIAAQVTELASRPGGDVIVAGSRTEWRVVAEGQRHGWLDIEFRPNRLFQSCYVMCRREALGGVRFRCNHMEWRDLAFQFYDTRASVCLSEERLVRITSSAESLSRNEPAMLMSALTNAKRYCATAAGRPEHKLFRRYLANCEKNMANLRLKQVRLFQAAGGYVRSFWAYRDPRNLIPFA